MCSEQVLERVVLWTDSITVLYWLQNKGEWKQFVKHRVDEILRLTKGMVWRHCPGLDNPADIGSRGCNALELKECDKWWNGPQWLGKSEEEWARFDVWRTQESKEEEKMSKVTCMSVNVLPQRRIMGIVDVKRFSQLSRLLKVSAWVMRFITNIRASVNKMEKREGELVSEELVEAEGKLIKVAQEELCNQDTFPQLVQRLGIINEQGVLWCKGRLGNSELAYEGREPIIVPRVHWFTELVIRDCHERIHHSGVKSTLAELRSKFWVPKGRQTVKNVIGKCQVCNRMEAKVISSPPIAQLPEFRVCQAEPFSRTGVDFAGPLFVKEKDGG
jgi:hypothetical protein